MTVSKKALTVTADNKTVTYGDAVPTYTASYTGFVLGESAGDLGGALLLDCAYAPGSAVGEYTITPSGLTSGNYAITFTPGALTVNKKVLTVTADNKAVTYGDDAPTYTAVYSGFVLGEDEGDLGGVLELNAEYVVGSAAGNYAITPSGVTSGNYAITFVPGTLVVSKKALTVTAANKAVTYGDAVPTYTANYSGFVLGENENELGGSLQFACTYAPGSAVGEYTITPSGLTSGNYAITFTPGTLTVSKKALTVTADNKTVTYGDAVPTYTVSYDGMTAGDTAADLGGSLQFACTYAPGSAVGEYTITPSGLTSGNYAITFTPGALTVNKKVLTVTADNKTVTYGDAAPTYTASYSGFVLGEDEGDLGGTLTFGCAYEPGSPVGTYPVSVGGLTSDNYSISFQNGVLTVEEDL